MNLVFGKPRKNKDNSDKKEEASEPEPMQEEPEPEPIHEPVQDSVETVQEPVIEPAIDSVKEQQVQQDSLVQEPSQEEAITPEEPQPIAEIAVVVEEQVASEEPRHETVRRGSHAEELPVSNYVIVGAFRLKENAQRYSAMLLDGGYANDFGFVTDKNVYYVYVHKSDVLQETREVRDRFRQLDRFQFSESWVLTVE
jgi:hypothetical protein